MMSTIHQTTTHYLMRSIMPTLGRDEAMYVEYGFARFVDSKAQESAVDEPLVLLAAIQWMNANHQSSYKVLARDIYTHNPDINGFENYITFCLDLLFSRKRCLSEVFKFCVTAPPWADMEAELVSLYCDDSDDIETGVASFSGSKAPSATLGVNAKNPGSILSWLGHHERPSFCFPISSMGPDVLFVLRLEDESLIWVALQTKWSRGQGGNISKKLLLQAMKSVTPSKYFLDKVSIRSNLHSILDLITTQNGQSFSPVTHPHLRDDTLNLLLNLPNRKEDGAGKYSLLRVVASFPAQTRMKRYIERDPDADHHPIAVLNMDLIKKVTRKLSPQDFLQLQESQDSFSSSRQAKENGKRKKTTDHGSSRHQKRLKI